MPVLQQGSSGPEVADLQNKLRARGFDPGVSDGSFGPGTAAAVEAFQRSAGLGADGVVGPQTAAALGLVAPAPVASAIPAVTVAMVCQMFPNTPAQNIEQNLPVVLNALVAPQLANKPMILMALGTIRAETESFLPISEGQSAFNTSPGGHPFDKYDSRADLGNQGPPDGERFKGRGFVQLTGRTNYQVPWKRHRAGRSTDPKPRPGQRSRHCRATARQFSQEPRQNIAAALATGDLATARRLVNGGSNGLDRFTDAYNIGKSLIPDSLSA